MQRIVFLGTDLRGSTRVACDANGRPVAWFGYDPYGAALESQSGDDTSVSDRLTRRYVGQVFEAQSGLYHYGARLCDTALARFVAVDPEYQTPSPYVYCANDPVDHADRDGAGYRLIVIYRRMEPRLWGFDDLCIVYMLVFSDGAFLEMRRIFSGDVHSSESYLSWRPYPPRPVDALIPTDQYIPSQHVNSNVMRRANRASMRMDRLKKDAPQVYARPRKPIYGFGQNTIIGRYIEDVAFRRELPSALALWIDQVGAAALFDAGGEFDPVTVLGFRRRLGALQEYMKPSQLKLLRQLEDEARALMQPLPPLRKPGEPPTGDIPPELLRDPDFKRAKFAWDGRKNRSKRKNQQLPKYHTTTTTTSVTTPAEPSSSEDEPPPLLDRWELEMEEPQHGGKEKPTPPSSDDESASL